jgi:hypothetical protein
MSVVQRDEAAPAAGDVAEFRGGRRPLLILAGQLAFLSFWIVMAVGSETPTAVARNLLYFALLLWTAMLLAQARAWLKSRRVRLTVTSDDIRLTGGVYSRVFRFRDVRAVAYVKNRKELVLHLADGTTAPLDVGLHWRCGEATRLILSRLGESVPRSEVRTDLDCGPIAAVLVPAAVLGVLFPLAVGEPIFGAALALSAGGIVVGVAVGIGIVRFRFARRVHRYRAALVCFGIVVLICIVVGLAVHHSPGGLYMPTPPVEVYAAVAFGLGLVVALAIARAREINAAVREAIASPGRDRSAQGETDSDTRDDQ